MRLNARILTNVIDINNFEYAEEAYVLEGQQNKIYLQITNASRDDIRYITQASVYSLTATFPALRDEDEIEVNGNQPFTDDKSIWEFTLTSDQLPNSGNFILTLVEDGVERKIKVFQSLVSELLDDSSC